MRGVKTAKTLGKPLNQEYFDKLKEEQIIQLYELMMAATGNNNNNSTTKNDVQTKDNTKS